jgi:hypothetical protein
LTESKECSQYDIGGVFSSTLTAEHPYLADYADNYGNDEEPWVLYLKFEKAHVKY